MELRSHLQEGKNYNGYPLIIIVSEVQLFMRDSTEGKRQAEVIGGPLQWIRTILFA